MSKKSIVIAILLLLIYFLLLNTLGIGIAILILAIAFLVQAVLFSIKSEYHDKFLKFMNPKIYEVYSEKGTDFIKKKRRINIIMYYIIFITMSFNSFMQIKINRVNATKQLFSLREYLMFSLITIVLVIITTYISKFIMKKSKTANEDFMWNVVVGIIFTAILFVIIGIYIFNKILS